MSAAVGRQSNADADAAGHAVGNRLSSSRLIIFFSSDQAPRIRVEATDEAEANPGNQRDVAVMFADDRLSEAQEAIGGDILGNCLIMNFLSIERLFSLQSDFAAPTGWRGLPEITSFLSRRPPNLTTLKMDEMTGTCADFLLLAEALRGLHLREFYLTGAHIVVGDADSKPAFLDLVVDSLLATPSLRIIAFGSCLNQISQPKRLALFDQMLEKLVFYGGDESNLDDDYTASIARALVSSRLLHFEFELSNSMSAAVTGKAFKEMFKLPTHLKRFGLKIPATIKGEELAVALIEGLAASQIEEVTLGFQGIMGPRTRKAVLKLAEQNLFLKGVNIHEFGAEKDDDGLEVSIKFFIDLNPVRRQLLSEQATAGEWVEALWRSSVANRVDKLHYLLSCNPELCATAYFGGKHCYCDDRKT